MYGRCPLCGGELVWQNDFSYEDYCRDGEGFVGVYSCSHCGATIEAYKDLDEESSSSTETEAENNEKENDRSTAGESEER